MERRLGLGGVALFVWALGAGCGGSKAPVAPPRPTPPPVAVPSTTAPPQPPEPPAPKTLYDRLGGTDGILAVVDGLLKNVGDDTRIRRVFEKVLKDKDRAAHLRGQLAALFCQEAGGDCKVDGRAVKAAHKELRLGDPEWNAFVEDLTKALRDKGVAEADQSELLQKLGAMHDDIVTVRKK